MFIIFIYSAARGIRHLNKYARGGFWDVRGTGHGEAPGNNVWHKHGEDLQKKRNLRDLIELYYIAAAKI